MAEIEVKILRTGGSGTVSITATLESTTLEVKQKIQAATSIAPEEQRLIFAGRVLKDHETLQQCSYKAGSVIHLVQRLSQNNAQQEAAAAARHQSTPTANIGGGPPGGGLGAMGMPPVNPFGGPMAGGLGGMGGPPNMQQMHEEMMSNPQLMQQMMENPMVQSMMNNPELMREMVMANPQMRALIESNPELGQALTDPETIRQGLQMAQNPALRQEMMRNNDRAMSNLESIPGGFNHLRRMHDQIQEPLMAAATQGNTARPAPAPSAPRTPPTTAAPRISAADAMRAHPDNPFIALLQPPSSSAGPPGRDPAPNPWAVPAGAGTTGATPGALGGANPFASMFGGAGAAQTTGPMGLGGMPHATPEALSQMDSMIAMLENNPAMQAMMDQMMSNPQLVEQQIAQNPMLQNNPMMQNIVRQTMLNPELRAQMMNPAMMRRAVDMQRGQGPPGTAPPTGNPFASLFGAGGGLGGGATPAAAAPTAATYAPQLQQMKDMGFYDEAANLQALAATQGNVSAAVERLLQQMG
eukprot:m.906977 g.906977  ORF g.906977 m.906977 type:complete len:526 (-) comp23710_c0_seq2:1840-3417(-)